MYRLPSLILMGVGVVFATGCAGGGESASQPSEQTGFQRDAGRAGRRVLHLAENRSAPKVDLLIRLRLRNRSQTLRQRP